MKSIEEVATKEMIPEHYELYKKYNKWELIHIIKAKDDVLELHRKFRNRVKEAVLKFDK